MSLVCSKTCVYCVLLDKNSSSSSTEGSTSLLSSLESWTTVVHISYYFHIWYGLDNAISVFDFISMDKRVQDGWSWVVFLVDSRR